MSEKIENIQPATTGSNGWKEPTTLWNAMFIGVFATQIGLNMGQQMSNSLLSVYAKAMGAPAEQIGSLMSMFAITALICRFFAGPAMNSFNRKKLNIMAMCILTIAYLGFSFAPKIAGLTGLPVITVLKLFRLFQGFGNAFGSACLLTLVSDAIPRAKFSSGMGIYALAQTISQAIGPRVGVALQGGFEKKFLAQYTAQAAGGITEAQMADITQRAVEASYNYTYIFNACIMTCAIIVSICLVRLAPRTPAKFSLKLSNMIAKEAILPGVVMFLVALGFTVISAFLLVYSEEQGIPKDLASWYFLVNAGAMALSRPLIGKLTDKHGFVKIAGPGFLLTAVSLIIIGYSKSWIILCVAAVLNGFGYGACQPALQSLCMKSVPAERRGSAAGTNYIFMDSATILGPMICGYLSSEKLFGYSPFVWIIMAIPVVIGSAVIVIFKKKIDQIEVDFKNRQ